MSQEILKTLKIGLKISTEEAEYLMEQVLAEQGGDEAINTDRI